MQDYEVMDQLLAFEKVDVKSIPVVQKAIEAA
jgi:hypothetical protein